MLLHIEKKMQRGGTEAIFLNSRDRYVNVEESMFNLH